MERSFIHPMFNVYDANSINSSNNWEDTGALHLDCVACTGKTHLKCESVSQHIFVILISIDIDFAKLQWWYVVSQEEKMDVFVIVCHGDLYYKDWR